jgi:ring-1,2-phenylacetyl-CoA epoxidase subunit PaaC
MALNDRLREDQQGPLKELLYKMADDQLIIGHRHSEWTGIGPVLEEDIAFSSIAQDKVGQSYQLYQALEKLGEAHPDRTAFGREELDMKCCRLVELPIGEYDFSLVRHFLFDHAEFLRFDALRHSSYEPLAQMAGKFFSEIKYHVFHANMWIKQLSEGSEEAQMRLQSALNQSLPTAYGIFEEGPFEEQLREEGLFIGEAALRQQWEALVQEKLAPLPLAWPEIPFSTEAMGGRYGYHSEHLQPLLEEMGAVFRTDPDAEW